MTISKAQRIKNARKFVGPDGTRNSEETRKFLDALIGERMTLGDTIKNIRQCDEIKQRDFAKKLHVSQAYLCDLEKNRKEISPRKAAEFAKMLGYPEKFFGETLLLDRQWLQTGVQDIQLFYL